MMKINRRSLLKSSVALSMGTILPQTVKAQSASVYTPPPYTADDLKGKLTPMGAERAGNADNTIPAWTGGGVPFPPNFVPGTPRPQPFPDEKPLFSITPSNYTQYTDKLCDGQIYLLKTYPNYRMDVYQTHRTGIAPQFVYDYTYKNASTAQLSADGNNLTGAYGGPPFPIPTNGHQVAWNHLLAWRGITTIVKSNEYIVPASGGAYLESTVVAYQQYPYYFPGGESEFKGIYFEALIDPTAPPYQAGGTFMQIQSVDPLLQPQRNYIYLPGERRTRAAPELQYDTAISQTGGMTDWDEYDLLYGALDQYDINLVTKKEMYIPYNMNKSWDTPVDVQYTPHFHNPDVGRWELHRVWVIELVLKSGKRNVDQRKILYTDEDTWLGMMEVIYDANGSLWKYQHAVPAICADIPAVIGPSVLIAYDFHSGGYVGVSNIDSSVYAKAFVQTPQRPASFYTPGQLAATAGGF